MLVGPIPGHEHTLAYLVQLALYGVFGSYSVFLTLTVTLGPSLTLPLTLGLTLGLTIGLDNPSQSPKPEISGLVQCCLYDVYIGVFSPFLPLARTPKPILTLKLTLSLT